MNNKQKFHKHQNCSDRAIQFMNYITCLRIRVHELLHNYYDQRMVIDFPRQITLNKNNKNLLFQNKTFDKIAEIKYHI